MTRRRWVVVLLIIALVVFAGLRFRKRAEAPGVVSVDASADAAIALGLPPAPPPVAPHYDKVILLANGHVLMPDKDVMRDWDPFARTPFREAKLGDAGPSHTFAFAPLGGNRFVVAKTDEEDHVQFELWDAEGLTFLRALGSYVAEDPGVELSPDGKRLMILACTGPYGKTQICEAGVYDVATGDLVHRTKLPELPGETRPVGRLSDAGTYFAVSAPGVPAAAYEVKSGRRLFTATDPMPSEVDDEVTGQIVHFAFIDDRRLLTASAMTGARLTDLSTGRAITHRLGGADEQVGELRVVLSPDRRRVASEIVRTFGGFGLSLFAFDDASGFDFEIPKAICPETCAMRWSGPRELVFNANVIPAETQLRVDATTGKSATEPYREPPPFDVFEAHPVRGDFDHYGTTKWHPEDRSAAFPKGALVSPRGVRIDLASIDIGALMSAAGDRFLVDALDGVRLFRSDGASAALGRPRSD